MITNKLNWKAKNILISVSVGSNIPDYSQPKCFVMNGDSMQLVKEMVDYLAEISQTSYDLLREGFSSIFNNIDQKLEELKQKSEEPTAE